MGNGPAAQPIPILGQPDLSWYNPTDSGIDRNDILDKENAMQTVPGHYLLSLLLHLFALVLGAAASSPPAVAQPLRIVPTVGGIGCLFFADCSIPTGDEFPSFSLTGTTGEGILLSRISQRFGEEGLAGHNLRPFHYRVDMRGVRAEDLNPCVSRVTIDFGPHTKLNYDGDGPDDDAFYDDTLGSPGGAPDAPVPTAMVRTGELVSVLFSPPVCPGQLSRHFGLAAPGEHDFVDATVSSTEGETRALRPLAPTPPAGRGSSTRDCFVPRFNPPFFSVPRVPQFAPLCRCFEDDALRASRCAFLSPEFLFVREIPWPVPPSGPFTARWELTPLTEPDSPVTITETLPQGFSSDGKQTIRNRFEFPAGGINLGTSTVQFNALAGGSAGQHTGSLRIETAHGSAEIEGFNFEVEPSQTPPGQYGPSPLWLLIPILVAVLGAWLVMRSRQRRKNS